ncbi:hypothetical protein DFH09DRAFT_1070069 [Mycena vulgaris]|nr:hypothetical protein DFH09DRAFT_1070069 [Mycena vulgaris]
MLYLRLVPHLKPLGSAITSIFVSTFAMLSVLWTIIGLIAGVLAGSQLGGSTRFTFNLAAVEGLGRPQVGHGGNSGASLFTREKGDKASLRTLVERLSLTSEINNIRMVEMQLTLARVCLSLRKHGILSDVDEKNRWDVEVDLTDLQHSESHQLLVQCPNRRVAFDSLA